MTWLRQILGVLVVAALAVGGWLLFSPSDTNGDGSAGTARGPGGGSAAPVITDAVTMAESGQTLRAIGTAEAVRSVTLYPSVSGEVRIVLFTAGEAVEPGNPLLMLDDEEEQLAVGLARIQMEEQQRVVARNEQLAPSGAVPASVAQSAQAQLAEARNRLAAAELALERRTLLAPFGGVMGLTGIAEGDRVTPTTPIATLDDRSSLLIAFEVPERYAAQVAIGQTVAATTSALPGAVFQGRISALDSRLDPGTRTLVVQATIPNVDDRLRAGLSFAVDLAFASTSLPSVPEMAVQWSRDGAFVWRIVDGAAERVPVSLVERTAGRVMVNAALAAGDRVVVEGTQRMREGRTVVEAMADTAADAEPGV